MTMQGFLSYFQNRPLIIATKHQKEKVIAPLVEKNMGVKTFVPESFDTDILGTFTGEIERKDDPITTLRNKCLMAMEKYGYDLGIASEGSFGPHPTLFFVNADDELLILIDKKSSLEIIARELSTETNFNGSEVKNENELRDFANKSLFPSHGLILRDKKDSHKQVIKGITDWQTLLSTYSKLMRTNRSAYVETDMRAMYNPSRMKVIEKATENLVAKINSLCPVCNTPGFAITDTRRGLPCSWCNMPTDSILSYIYSCGKCNHTLDVKYPHQKTFEEPVYCQNCNP